MITAAARHTERALHGESSHAPGASWTYRPTRIAART